MFRRLKSSPWRSFGVTCAGVFCFYLAFARLLVKTDDGHFLGILNSPGFRLRDWLAERYATLSGRTVGEALMMTFLRLNPLAWKLASAALLCFVAWCFCRLALARPGSGSKADRLRFGSACVWLVLPTCMSAGAFWFAGSFTYLWPAAAVLLAALPAARALLQAQRSGAWWLHALACLAAPLAAAQEQAAATVLALLLCLNLLLLAQKRWRWRFLLPLLPAAVGAWFLFRSPGAQLRSLGEAAGGFPDFLNMHLAEKLLLGASNYFAYAFFLSIPAMTLLLLALHQALRQSYPGRRCRALTTAHGVAWGGLCIGGNLVCLLARRKIPDQLFTLLFTRGEGGLFAYALLALCGLFFLSVVGLLLLLLRKNKAAARGAGLCCAVAVGCGVAPGLSGSVYASGQRIFFFSDLFLLLAAALLFGCCAADSRRTRLLRRGAPILAALCFAFQCAGFVLLEIPPMG
ncbi:MAG: DUF6056 family protein [Oscillospiraceae bacterium]|nr:DUF6056 family protein [Oscillospiraceae bacterium]